MITQFAYIHTIKLLYNAIRSHVKFVILELRSLVAYIFLRIAKVHLHTCI